MNQLSRPVPSTEAQDAPSQHQLSELLGVSFSNISLDDALESLTAVLKEPSSTNLFFVNSHCLNVSFDTPEYRQALKRADLVFPDGSGVAMGCEMNGETLKHNLNGTDLFPLICQLVAAQGKRLYLLGATSGTPQRVAAWATAQYPGLKIVGTQHGYFTPEQETAIVDDINRSEADVLLVAMGVPTQELWLDRIRPQLNTKLNVAVGGLFDFYAGNVSRAPLWMRERGCEWIWRLLQEPMRMWQRYIIGNPLFALRARYEAKTRAFIKQIPDKFANESRRSRLAWQAGFKRFSDSLRLMRLTSTKRVTDLTLACAALLVLMPVLLIVAVAIKLESPGPVFFKQTRAGYRGRPFSMWKFRSMVANAESLRSDLEALNEMSDGVTFKIKSDPRITRVGAFIRKYSIDELPQFFNVLKGEMSIVGPRPGLYSELTKYNPEQRYRLDLRPGLTSEWVVAGRNDLSFSEQAALDVAYRKHRSFFGDLKLMIKTVPALLLGRGAS
ncbi:WecB/TagA/CpsF family glycosyltransferase [Marinobacter sp.]|uniref:WecB/TagA/CpsF family glycosyltransferase n=1 Tax=Marinobacter sp. TaxID=50741 RepID=UPI002B26FA6A|nr:WecB/TagA/CpsF family glycosyltransferase [Marinobacter sp.]